MLSDLIRDLRHSLRLLAAAPGFTAVAVLTLALGVGANTAIFSVINGVLLRPLPYDEPERLMSLDGVFSRPEGDASFQLAYPDFEDLRQARTIEAVAPWTTAWGLALEGSDGAARLQANFVGRDYFGILNGVALLGRTFAAGDHAIGADGSLVAILSEPAWRQHFGADPNIVGRDVRLQGRLFTIIGVMPASFHDVALSHSELVAVWAPIERAPALFPQLSLDNRGNRLMWGVARLAGGASQQQLAAELGTISSQLTAAHPATNTAFSLRAMPLSQTFFVDARRPLWLLLGGSLFVLLIGCANVANLLLVRASARSREIAVRIAIGASTNRIVRQLLTESTVLALLGGAAGLGLTMWLTPALVALSGVELPAFTVVSIDRTVLLVGLATALGCGMLFGLAPVWRAATIGRDAIATSGSGRVARSSRAATWLAGVEVAAGFVLAAGALLMLQSFTALTRTDLSFRHDHLLTVRLELPQDRYPTPAARARAGSDMLERLRAVPGTEQALIWGPSMFARSTWVAFLTPDDRLAADDGERLMVWRHSTNPGALSDLGIRIVAGRDLAATDTLDTPQVAVVSAATAARLWPQRDAIGRQFRSGSGATATMVTVVGVAADARHRGRFRFSQGAAAYEPQLDIYHPYAQRPNSLVTFGVRTSGAPGAHAGAVRAAIAGSDPTIPIYDIAPLESRMRAEESSVGFAALLLNLYGVLALVLAAIGVYGVLAAGVASRMRELGIRAALGADPLQLQAGVMRDGLAVAVCAVAAGGAVSWALARTFGGLLFGVSPTDAVTLVAAAVLLITMAGVASLIPARRAARVDPVQVLRND